jgi:hypothetical protein
MESLSPMRAFQADGRNFEFSRGRRGGPAGPRLRASHGPMIFFARERAEVPRTSFIRCSATATDVDLDELPLRALDPVARPDHDALRLAIGHFDEELVRVVDR